jgi:hypothetical protein
LFERVYIIIGLAFVVFAIVSATGESAAGADTIRDLESGIVDALLNGDGDALGHYLVDADTFIEACPTRFKSMRPDDFKRRLANNRRRLLRRLSECSTKLGTTGERERRSGGLKRQQLHGCSESVWQFTDVTVEVMSEGRRVEVTLSGVVGVAGRYFVLDQVRCR